MNKENIIMPIYEYICTECKEEFNIFIKRKKLLQESLQEKIKELENKCCTEKNIQRKISIPSISFKGKGFHKNDYKEKT